MEEKMNEIIKLVLDLRGITTLINRYTNMIDIDEVEDSYITTTLKSLPTNEELDSLIFYLKEKKDKLSQVKLYCLESDIASTDGVKITEVKILKETDKQYQVDQFGYNRISKYDDLNVDKGRDNKIMVFSTDKNKGIMVVKKAIEHKVQEIRKQLEEYNNTIAKININLGE